jgi:spore germination cell wall hydrolase CwlJ-like protein
MPLAADCAKASHGAAESRRAGALATAARDLSGDALGRLIAGMEPATLALARRHDPARRSADLWGRPTGWAKLDLTVAPDLGMGWVTGQNAREINALRPIFPLNIRPMRPFTLHTDEADSDRALRCLTQAVYFEAAREPPAGQEAVAQVVLNRLRHPAYPKSVCGVVFQGAGRTSGCQFSFTCDGSLRWAPEPRLWTQAKAVAQRALGGFVQKEVGSATHYHADYVAPYWAPTLVKMRQIGAHIFYRWTGPWGEPAAFTGRYAGEEAHLSQAILQGVDPRIMMSPPSSSLPPSRKVTLAVAGEVRTYTVVDPLAVGGQRTRVFGTIAAARRQPTPDEVAKINDSLSAAERFMDDEAPLSPARPVAPTPQK